MGQLTTHVLDTANGCPAGNMAICLWRIDGTGDRHLLKRLRTNADGRTERPLLVDGDLIVGIYELEFDVGSYFALQSQELMLSQPAFLTLVPVRFGIADASQHYHVPLLVSPWSYSTYRGS